VAGNHPRQASKHLFQINRHFRHLWVKGLILGLLIALAGIVLASTSAGRWMEEEVALTWLFKLRGVRSAPPEVVVISIDRTSSEQLGLSNKPRKWPRALHGELLNKLAANGASMVAFDVIFEEIRDPADNRKFARAIQQAGNVVLFQYLKKDPLNIGNDNRKPENIGIVERLISPVPILEKAAIGLAPFPLPKVPARINHFILFKPALGNISSLPVLGLLVHSLPAYDNLLSLLKIEIPNQISSLPASIQQIRQNKSIHELASELRQLFLHNPGLKSRLMAKLQNSPQAKSLRSLITSFTHPDSMYLNFYGPPQTITTIPYYKILQSSDMADIDLKGKAVFVGFAEQFQPDQQDAFYTVFTEQQSGLDVSGVEIAATAFANLLDNSTLTVSSARVDIFILVLWGVILGLILRLLPGQLVIPAAIMLALFYGLLTYQLFDQHDHWLPFAIPLLWQAPLGIMATLLWKYVDVQRERHNIRHAFGYHLPVKVVDQLAKGVDHITETGQTVHGIVLATDAEQYTTLAEQLEPAQLHDLMNRYYETLFSPIRQAGGVISDVVGDAALAIWTSAKPDKHQRQQACQAALDIQHAVDQLNQTHTAHALPTRLGLHFGEVVMGHVGAVDHYEYRAVGDIVNTASRIEGLNKQLGTRIIVSAQVLDDLDDFITRELGRFLLKGKRQPLTLYELVDRKTEHHDDVKNNFVVFQTALHAFQTQNWQAAADSFKQFILAYGEDGPSRYYLSLIQQYSTHTPPEWDGVIELSQK